MRESGRRGEAHSMRGKWGRIVHKAAESLWLANLQEPGREFVIQGSMSELQASDYHSRLGILQVVELRTKKSYLA